MREPAFARGSSDILFKMHEVDLHDLTTDEALRVFVEFYNKRTRGASRDPFRVIHGYGSSGEGGKIRRKLRAFLESAAECLDWRSGEDFEGNSGVTIVFPRTVLPSIEDQLAADIVKFCATPRTESKIAGEFRKHGPREIKQAIRGLVRQGQIKEVVKGGTTTYTANI